ncbi:hypothetical protein BDQ12DRAFT_721067 [Crucibulum laeve]|uniref:Uncharacterized protein n=1 Tax=Crucibulum laeve TaxID=68775 RepID=A0A5C3M7E2_9AGAR|nr:hypothetical protein BDQ12DRAFT_721067 [Crucibulum laeve]
MAPSVSTSKVAPSCAAHSPLKADAKVLRPTPPFDSFSLAMEKGGPGSGNHASVTNIVFIFCLAISSLLQSSTTPASTSGLCRTVGVRGLVNRFLRMNITPYIMLEQDAHSTEADIENLQAAIQGGGTSYRRSCRLSTLVIDLALIVTRRIRNKRTV